MHSAQIFLSTVSSEFRTYRDGLRTRLKRHNVDVHVQEDFIATGTPTLDKLDTYIRDCAAVIHLVGDATGSVAKAASLKAITSRYPDFARRVPALKSVLSAAKPTLSYTQWEAYLALYHERPLYIAVPGLNAPRDCTVPPKSSQRLAQRRHLERLKALERYPEITFENPTDLAAKLLQGALLDILVELKRAVPASRVSIIPATHPPAAPTAAAAPTDAAKQLGLQQVERGFLEAVGKALGDEFLLLRGESWWERIPASSLDKIVPVCVETLPLIRQLSSGSELKAVKPLLTNIMKIGEAASERGISDARRLEFDAVDELVHCDTFVQLPGNLADESALLDKMAALAVSDGMDVALLQRYWARMGDVLKIRGADNTIANNRALEALRNATQFTTSNSTGLGYHSFRSLCIVAARSNMTHAEFDRIVGQLEDTLLSGRLNAHEQAHFLDGVTEAYAYRFVQTKHDSYRREAIKHLELARAQSKLAATRDGVHTEFSLRLEKLPIILAQSGIIEPFGAAGKDAHAEYMQAVLQTLKRASAAGSDRVAAQMTAALIQSYKVSNVADLPETTPQKRQTASPAARSCLIGSTIAQSDALETEIVS